MKYIGNIQKFLIAITVLLLYSCNSTQTLDSLTPNYSQQNITKTTGELATTNLCSLLENPYSYHQKVITVKTTLYRIGSTISLGDEKCVSRHPLVDVEFDPKFESSVCSLDSETENKLCLIAKPNDQNKENSNLVITGDLLGYFEYFRSDEGFTSNGLRFRFVVQAIKNIEKITDVKTENLN